MNLKDILPTIAILGLSGWVIATSLKSCYNNCTRENSQQQMHREADKPEPTTRQARFGTYVPGDANSNYDSNSR